MKLVGGKEEHLLKVRNPWGHGEWQGDWGDDSKLWKSNPKVAAELDFRRVDDGTFWISWNDFCRAFSRLEVCRSACCLWCIKNSFVQCSLPYLDV